jgi:hypothetical protein
MTVLYYTEKNGQIDEVSTFKFNPNCKETDKDIIMVDGKKYIEGTEPQKPLPLLRELKSMKIREINDEYSIRAGAVKIDTPEDEIKSWPTQESEAIAFSQDPGASTPFLDELAKNRGIPKDLLVEKVLEKVAKYKSFMGQLTGIRQKIEDKIKAATTKKEVEKITWPISE